VTPIVGSVINGQNANSDIDKAVKDFSKRLKASVETGGGHFEHSQ